MDWVTAIVLSAFVLGFYDLCIKHAVHDNAVLPVLFLSNLCSAGIWTTLLAVDRGGGGVLPAWLHVAPLDAHSHLLLFGKSALVACAWICSYFAMKHLPLSLAAPVRSMAPLVTFACAVLVLGERLNRWQALGILLTLASFVGLSLAGRREGVHFHRDKWIWLLGLGTIFNGLSSLYDKVLLGRLGLDAQTVQAWFSIYLAVIFLPFAIAWKARVWPRNAFQWRASLIGVSLFLLVADFLYFSALRSPDAYVSVVSSVRRGSALVAFAGGALLFGEANAMRKLPALLGILAGVIVTLLH